MPPPASELRHALRGDPRRRAARRGRRSPASCCGTPPATRIIGNVVSRLRPRRPGLGHHRRATTDAHHRRASATASPTTPSTTTRARPTSRRSPRARATGNGGDFDAGALDLLVLIAEQAAGAAEGHLQDDARSPSDQETMPDADHGAGRAVRGARASPTSTPSRCPTKPAEIEPWPAAAGARSRRRRRGRRRWRRSRRRRRSSAVRRRRRAPPATSDDARHRRRWHARSRPPARRPPADPARHIGPQGRVGQFVVDCAYSHSAPDDPIVHPGMAGHVAPPRLLRRRSRPTRRRRPPRPARQRDHLRQDGRHRGLLAPDAVRRRRGRWSPIELARLLPGRARRRPRRRCETMPVRAGADRRRPDRHRRRSRARPPAGPAAARTGISDDPPDLPGQAPRCTWCSRSRTAGTASTSTARTTGPTSPTRPTAPAPTTPPGHDPAARRCRSRFPISGAGHDLRLASGNVYSAHGDFLNAWDPAGLEREIEACIHRDAVCDLASNRDEDPIFSGPG